MFSTALKHRWLALNEGVKMGERCVGYAAEECSRMTVLQTLAKAITRNCLDLRMKGSMQHHQTAVQCLIIPWLRKHPR
jgi:hypothetical protein